MAVVWNSADKNAAIVLSLTDHRATQSGASSAWRGVRSTTGYLTGKWYFEGTISAYDSNNGVIFGVASSLASLATFVGGDSRGFGYQVEGTCWYNGGAVSGAHMRTTGLSSTIGIAVDLTNKLIWASAVSLEPTVWNLGTAGTQNPSTNQGGIALNATVVDGSNSVFIAFAGDRVGGTNDAMDLNTGDSAFINTIPTGFTAWNGVGSLLDAAVCVISG